MRSAERGSKTVVFIVPGDRWYHAPPSEGGVGHDFSLRCTTAVFVYLTHSAVVSQFESAILRPKGRMMAGTRATPPPKKWGVAIVLIYPCGKAWKPPPFPSRFIVSDRSSPSRVRFAASRPGRLRDDPKDAMFTRGKGGGRAVGCEDESLVR